MRHRIRVMKKFTQEMRERRLVWQYRHTAVSATRKMAKFDQLKNKNVISVSPPHIVTIGHGWLHETSKYNRKR